MKKRRVVWALRGIWNRVSAWLALRGLEGTVALQHKGQPPDIEARKLYLDVKLRRRALDLEREKMLLERERLDSERLEKRRMQWSSPLFLSVIAGAVALFGSALGLMGNAYTALLKNADDFKVEQIKQQGNLVLEAIKTGGDADKATLNLRLLAKAHLLTDVDTQKAILAFTETTQNIGVQSSPAGLSAR